MRSLVKHHGLTKSMDQQRLMGQCNYDDVSEMLGAMKLKPKFVIANVAAARTMILAILLAHHQLGGTHQWHDN